MDLLKPPATLPPVTTASAEHRTTALDRAKTIIYGDREKTYGNPAKNLNVIAEYWSTHLSAAKGQNSRLTVEDVCVMMILLKQARLANSPKHSDSIDDTIGYAALLDRIHSDVPVLSEVVPKQHISTQVPPNR